MPSDEEPCKQNTPKKSISGPSFEFDNPFLVVFVHVRSLERLLDRDAGAEQVAAAEPISLADVGYYTYEYCDDNHSTPRRPGLVVIILILHSVSPMSCSLLHVLYSLWNILKKVFKQILILLNRSVVPPLVLFRKIFVVVSHELDRRLQVSHRLPLFLAVP